MRTPLIVLLFLLNSMLVWGGGPFFNVLDYGAKNDGSARATAGINAAIQAAKAAGGGTVYIPAGKYVTGPIELVSNLILYIDAGATLQFPAEHLSFTKGRHQGIECLTAVPLIGGHDLENVTITGRGTITTNNADWMKIMGRSQGSAAGPNWAHLLESLEHKTPATEEEYLKAAPELRPPFIQAMNSKNILIEGIHIIGSAMWPIHLLYSENAVVRDVIVETYPGVHTGGIYVDSSKDIRISDCFIETGDDGIVLKSGKDADGLRVNRPTENVSITNCTIRRAHGAITLGSETAGGIRNIVVSNITCQGTQIGIRIKSRRGRGGFIEDVRFSNLTMEEVGQAINITNYYQMEGETKTPEEPVSNRTPIFRNIAISNITIHNARVAIYVEGLPEMPISGLRISDVAAVCKIGLKASNTTAMELHHVQLNAETGPTFMVRNSKDLELDGVSTRKPVADEPVIRLDACLDAIIRNSRAYEGTGTFLSIGNGELKSIAMEGNVLGHAKQASIEETKEFWKNSEPATEGE
ncbi:MAG TPA: glycosyl hydrolase family 28 protein [Bacteroidales bacterium]